MKYENIKNEKSEQFRRLTGIKPKTFEKMLLILEIENKIKKSKGGKKINSF